MFRVFFCVFFYRTYTFNDRRYGHYQPNGYGYQYPGQKHPNQYPAGVPLGEDKFKYDPVGRQKFFEITHKINDKCIFISESIE